MKKVSENDLIIYGLYTNILDSFKHYNKIQITYKIFVSTWLFATFLGIGYTISANEVNLPFHPLLISTLISAGSLFGLSLICYLDLIVIERSIIILVCEGLELEKKNNWIPQYIHTCSLVNTQNHFITTKSLFYLGCYLILFITMISSIFLYFFLKHYSYLSLLIIISCILIIYSLFIFFLIFKKRSNFQKIYSQIKGMK